MLELNKSYDARFLGKQVITSAVTSEVICRLVHELPETIQGGIKCRVLCSASGLTVSRVVTAGSDNGGKLSAFANVMLKVPLNDILFCHVDKGRPEVTVWVVRSKDARSESPQNSLLTPGAPGAQTATANLNAYIYKCLNTSDALGLFQVYNEVNRQAKLDKYRRNAEKRDDQDGTPPPAPKTLDIHKDSDGDESVTGSSISSGSSSTSLTPSVTIVAPSNPGAKYGAPASNGKLRPLDNVANNEADDLSSPAWSTIAGSIENYRQSFGMSRPKDKEMRAAMLEELREKLRSRYKGSEENPKRAPLADSTNSQGSKHLASNRQRKPAKVIHETTDIPETQEKVPQQPIHVLTFPPSNNQPNKGFPFPWSMTNMVKKLVHKNRTNGFVSMPMVPLQGVWMLPVKSPLTQVPVANHAPTRKFKTKGPAPLPPGPLPPPKGPNIPPRMLANGIDPYFYLPPIPVNSSDSKGRSSMFVPVLPPAWVHKPAGPIKNGTKGYHCPTELNGVIMLNGNQVVSKSLEEVPSNGTAVILASPSKPIGHKKKVHVVHAGLNRFSRGHHKKRFPPPNYAGAFNRSSSTASRGSTSSDSGPEGKLRSVMKKPRQTDDNTEQQKKNVTFHAFATVQVLP